MIVMSTHGRSGISRWRLGSVAGRVLRESETPLLAIGPTVASRELAPVELGRIMIALDGSAFGEAALPIAQELAAALGAHVTLARSIASAFIQYPFAPIALTLPAVDDQLAAEASAYLESKAASFAARGSRRPARQRRGHAALRCHRRASDRSRGDGDARARRRWPRRARQHRRPAPSVRCSGAPGASRLAASWPHDSILANGCLAARLSDDAATGGRGARAWRRAEYAFSDALALR